MKKLMNTDLNRYFNEDEFLQNLRHWEVSSRIKEQVEEMYNFTGMPYDVMLEDFADVWNCSSEVELSMDEELTGNALREVFEYYIEYALETEQNES